MIFSSVPYSAIKAAVRMTEVTPGSADWSSSRVAWREIDVAADNQNTKSLRKKFDNLVEILTESLSSVVRSNSSTVQAVVLSSM